MRDWELLDHEDVPNDEGTLYLLRRGGEYAIHVDGRELMTNKLHGSEDALADLACDRLASLDDARILVGGLGMGFTLAAALRRVGPAGQVTVAELMPAVISWNQTYPGVGRPAGHPLRDARVAVHQGDVGDLYTDGVSRWNAILLDVDNGPKYLTRPTNGWLYSEEGLAAAWDALLPGGVLAIWSADDDPSLTRRLKQAGFEVEVIEHVEEGRETFDDSGNHVLWVGRRADGPA